MNTNYRYVRKVVDKLGSMGILMLCRGDPESRGICWELTDEGNDIGVLLEKAELLLGEAFHNHYKQ